MKKSNLVLIIGVIIASLLIISWIYNLKPDSSTEQSAFMTTGLLQQGYHATINSIIESIQYSTKHLMIKIF